MKIKTLWVILIAVISCFSFSCNNQKSLQELLQEESRAMEKFITMNGFQPLPDYPKDSIFKENEYFKTSDGLFFHVVSPGNGTKVKLGDEVCIRFDYSQNIKDVVQGDTLYWVPPPSDLPYSFVYGIPQTYTSSYYYSYYGYYSPLCQAWVIPLPYISEGAVIDMIIPSSIGSYSDNTNITPVFYKNLRYTRFN